MQAGAAILRTHVASGTKGDRPHLASGQVARGSLLFWQHYLKLRGKLHGVCYRRPLALLKAG